MNSLPNQPSDDLVFDGAETPAAASTDDTRWQSTRAVLGLGAVVLAALITLSVLGGFGDNGSDDDAATISETDEPATDATSTPEVTATPEPTPEPTSTPTSTRAPQPDDPDGPADTSGPDDDPSAETDQVIAGWDQVSEIFDGEGVLAVQRDRTSLDLIEMATGRWQTIDTPYLASGLTSSSSNAITQAGIVSTDRGQATFYPWSDDDPIPIGEFGERPLGVSDDIAVLADPDDFFTGGDDLALTAHDLRTGATKTIDLSTGLGPNSFVGFFGAFSVPLTADVGDGTAVWTFDEGWSHLGSGNPVAVASEGLILKTCTLDGGDLACQMETTTLDGTRKPVHPSVTLNGPFGTALSPDLRWLGMEVWRDLEGRTYELVDLETGSVVDAGDIIGDIPEVVGTWLGESGVFARLGERRSLRLINAATGQTVEIDEPPWGARSSSTGPGAITAWIDMDFPEPRSSTAD